MKYQVNVSVMIHEQANEDGTYKSNFPSSMLSYSRSYTITANTFAELAPKIDLVVNTIESVTDK